MPYIYPMGHQLMYFKNPVVSWLQGIIVSRLVFWWDLKTMFWEGRTLPQSNFCDTNGNRVDICIQQTHWHDLKRMTGWMTHGVPDFVWNWSWGYVYHVCKKPKNTHVSTHIYATSCKSTATIGCLANAASTVLSMYRRIMMFNWVQLGMSNPRLHPRSKMIIFNWGLSLDLFYESPSTNQLSGGDNLQRHGMPCKHHFQ